MSHHRLLEKSLLRIRGVDNKEIYPTYEPKRKYKRGFSKNSTFVVTIHFAKSLFSPTILAFPAGFYHGGLAFSCCTFILLTALVAFNMKRLIDIADYLSEREQIPCTTYDQVAYLSFYSCPMTKNFAVFFKHVINILFIMTYLLACIIFMIFVARNIECVVCHYFPQSFLDVHYVLFFQVIFLMFMSSVRELKYLTPFSFVGTALLLVVVGCTLGFFFLKDVGNPDERYYIGDFISILQLISIILFCLSGISISLTLKSSMSSPEDFYPALYISMIAVFCCVYSTFGFFGYLKYGNETRPSVMLNLPCDSLLSISIKAAAVLSIFLSSPISFYIAFNVLWNNYLKQTVSSTNVMYAEFFVRYCLIAVAFVVAMAIPDLGIMIMLKGSMMHSLLEVTFPAIVDYVAYYPEKGTGKCHCRLLKVIIIVMFGLIFWIGGVASVIVPTFSLDK